jgi:hypothetical protein
LLPVEDRHAHSGARKFQRNGSADYSTARNGHVELLLHNVILSHLVACFFRGLTLTQANCVPGERTLV